MKFIDRFKIAVSNTSLEEYLHRFITGEDLPENSITAIDAETAMKYSAVFACCRVLAETFASVPMLEYKKKGNEEREQTADTAVYDILHNAPNDEMSPFNLKEAWMMALNLGGNTVSERIVNRSGELVGLYPYEWQKVKITRSKETNKLVYSISNGSESRDLKRAQVFHIPGMSLNGVTGLSPIEYATQAIRLGLSYEKFGVNFYKNGANTSIAIRHPGKLGDEAYKRLKSDFAKSYQGLANAGKPILLEDGVDIKELTIKPVDAQLIESKRFQLEDIARVYRVPMHLIQDLSRSTNNNIEHQSLEFIMYTMLPWFKRAEENINMQLLTSEERKAGYYIEAKLDALLRGDAVSRAMAYATGRQWGWLSVNDIRRLENMNGIGSDGDIYLQPSNMIEAGADQLKALQEQYYKMITERK